MPDSLIDQTERLLVWLHQRARRKPAAPGEVQDEPLTVADRLKLVDASVRFLAAKAKIVPEDTGGSELASLRDELNGSGAAGNRRPGRRPAPKAEPAPIGSGISTYDA